MIFYQFFAIKCLRKQLKISSSFSTFSATASFSSFTLTETSSWFLSFWSLLDEFGFESFFESFCLVVFKSELSFGSNFFSIFPSVSELSSLNPVVSGHTSLPLILNLSSLRNWQFGSLLPLKICLFTFFFFWHFVLLVLCPDKVLFGLVPYSFFGFFLHVLVLNYVLHFIRSDLR